MITVTAPGHPVKAGAGYDCACGECDYRRGLLRSALVDAIGYREGEGSTDCTDCDTAPDGLCEDHASDLALAGEYRQLARDLEGRPVTGSADG